MRPMLARAERAKSLRFSAGCNVNTATRALWAAVVVDRWLTKPWKSISYGLQGLRSDWRQASTLDAVSCVDGINSLATACRLTPSKRPQYENCRCPFSESPKIWEQPHALTGDGWDARSRRDFRPETLDSGYVTTPQEELISESSQECDQGLAVVLG
jgi:hypothetical protein